MKCTILQSAYLPWLGFFDFIDQSDYFIFLDDVQWTKRDWRSRNRCRTPQGWSWLTVPVNLKKSSREYKICEVGISYSQPWIEKHLNLIYSCYKKTPFFPEVFPLIEKPLREKHSNISNLNYALVLEIVNYLGIKDVVFKFSQKFKNVSHLEKSDKLIAILKTLPKVKVYISGVLAKNYIDEDQFKEVGYSLLWHDYKHPYYNQKTWKQDVFISHLSIVDLLFNHGQESLDILTGRMVIPKPKNVRILTPEDLK